MNKEDYSLVCMETQGRFMLLTIMKIAYDEGIYDAILDLVEEVDEEEGLSCCFEEITIEILSTLYETDYIYNETEEDGETYTIQITDRFIENYYKTYKEYVSIFGEGTIPHVVKEYKYLIGCMHSINSYCYNFNFVHEKNSIVGISFNHSPEFDLYSDLLQCTYELMEFYRKTEKTLREKLEEKLIKDAA